MARGLRRFDSALALVRLFALQEVHDALHGGKSCGWSRALADRIDGVPEHGGRHFCWKPARTDRRVGERCQVGIEYVAGR